MKTRNKTIRFPGVFYKPTFFNLLENILKQLNHKFSVVGKSVSAPNPTPPHPTPPHPTPPHPLLNKPVYEVDALVTMLGTCLYQMCKLTS